MPRKRKPARLYQRKDDGAWLIIDCGKQIRTGFGDGFHEQAEEALSRYIREKSSKEITTVDPSRFTVGEALVRYGEAKAGLVKDPERLLYTIKALAPYWADKMVSEVDEETCKGYVKWRKKSAWTTRREMNSLNAALKHAALKRRITYAPEVVLPPKGTAKDRWLSQEEAESLMEQSAPHVRRFIRIAFATGRRKSAILGLKWVPSLHDGWVDLERGVVHFLGKAEEETKKKKGIVRSPSKRLAEMRSWERDGPNVVSFEGQPVKNIKTAFNNAVQRAGLEDVTPHTLKHTAVTWAFIEGMSLEMATDYFATSRETLEDVYRSYSPDAQKAAAAIMDRTL
jgi:integrase